MKFFILLFTFTFTLFGAQIDKFASDMGYYRNYDTAMMQAKKENKVLMLVVVGDYCPWCRKFERKTLKRASIAMSINKKYIPLIVDKKFDKKNFPEKYHAKRVPTVYFIEPKNELMVFESLGYVKKDEYQDTLDLVLTKYQKAK